MPRDPAPTPRRQETPPDAEGLWTLVRDGYLECVEVMHWSQGQLVNLGGPSYRHHRPLPGDVWSGPFPVPRVPEQREAEDARE